MRQQLQSRSVGDLCGGLGQKSLTWDDQKAVVGTTPGEGGEREKEARDGGSRSSRRSRRGETTDVKTTDEGGGCGLLQTVYHMLRTTNHIPHAIL